MRRPFILTLLAALALLLGVSAPAAAGWDWQKPAGWDWQAPAAQTAQPTGWDWNKPTGWDWRTQTTASSPLNPWRLSVSNVCVFDHYASGTPWPVYTAAQTLNAAADLNAVYDYGLLNGCVGYTGRSTIDVWYWSDANDPRCAYAWVGRSADDPLYVDEASVWVNIGRAGCHTTSVNRAYWISHGIGYIVGLAEHANGADSVMSTTGWAQDNQPYLRPYDYQGIETRYPW
jgi:hypothetical protein